MVGCRQHVNGGRALPRVPHPPDAQTSALAARNKKLSAVAFAYRQSFSAMLTYVHHSSSLPTTPLIPHSTWRCSCCCCCCCRRRSNIAWPGTTDSHRQQIPSAEPHLAGDSWNPEPPVVCSSPLQSIPEAQLFTVYIVIHPRPWVIHRMPVHRETRLARHVNPLHQTPKPHYLAPRLPVS